MADEQNFEASCDATSLDGASASTGASLMIRPYRASDAASTLGVFFSAIRRTASADYNAEQIEAWASPEIDLEGWAVRREALNTTVATLDEVVVGFTDVDRSGYIDMLFVDPAHGRRGIATALLSWVLEAARGYGVASLATHASITAKPFFEAQGFVVEKQRREELGGVILTNYAMSRPIF